MTFPWCSVRFLELWGVVLVHATWQFALVACLVAHLGHKARAPRSFGTRCLVALLICPWLMLVTFVLLSSGWMPFDSALLGQRFLEISVAGWLARLWLCGAAGAAALWLAAWRRVHRLRQLPGLPLAASGQSAHAERGVPVRVIETALISGPVTVGWRRPIILVPHHCLESLTAQQLQFLLEHERAHIERGDFFWNSVQSFVEVATFFHPAVWLLSRWIRREREFACDDNVLSLGANAVGYARTLAQLAQHDHRLRSGYVAALGAPLKARVERLLKCQAAPRVHRRQVAVCWLTLLIGLGVALAGIGAARGAEDDEKIQPGPTAGTAFLSVHCCPN